MSAATFSALQRRADLASSSSSESSSTVSQLRSGSDLVSNNSNSVGSGNNKSSINNIEINTGISSADNITIAPAITYPSPISTAQSTSDQPSADPLQQLLSFRPPFDRPLDSAIEEDDDEDDHSFALDSALQGGISAVSSRRPSYAAEFASRPRLVSLEALSPVISHPASSSIDPDRWHAADPSINSSSSSSPWQRSRTLWSSPPPPAPASVTANGNPNASVSPGLVSHSHPHQQKLNHPPRRNSSTSPPSRFPNSYHRDISPPFPSSTVDPFAPVSDLPFPKSFRSASFSQGDFPPSHQHSSRFSLPSIISEDQAVFDDDEPADIAEMNDPFSSHYRRGFEISPIGNGAPKHQAMSYAPVSNIWNSRPLLPNQHQNQNQNSFRRYSFAPGDQLLPQSQIPGLPIQPMQPNFPQDRSHLSLPFQTIQATQLQQQPQQQQPQQQQLSISVSSLNGLAAMSLDSPVDGTSSGSTAPRADQQTTASVAPGTTSYLVTNPSSNSPFYQNLVNEVDSYFTFAEDDRIATSRSLHLAKFIAYNTESLMHTSTDRFSKLQRLYIVQFKGGRIDVFYLPDGSGLHVRVGDLVIVDGDRGKDLGKVTQDGVSAQSARQLKKIQFDEQQAALSVIEEGPKLEANMNSILQPKQIIRFAQPMEIQQLFVKKFDEAKALRMCINKIGERNLEMNLRDAEYQWDRRKLTFFYTATRRIDFRDLVRDLFKVYKTRIWMCAVST
ncbi:PSP1 C-terminal conserved region-domain-containing protein [Lipomyces oligophaga]|uniref:PSP1 C-terminal conserved region-domain-containing protein n=1 Tax=Lipomyces oligophaga TaxID=45792 RepID=UPI0034CD9D75